MQLFVGLNFGKCEGFSADCESWMGATAQHVGSKTPPISWAMASGIIGYHPLSAGSA